MPALELVRGAEMIASFRLDAPVVVLGRSDECDITLGGPLVSHRHCRFVESGGAYVVHDLGSANGDGDRIAVVPYILFYRARDKVSSAVPPSGESGAATDTTATTKLDSAEILRHLKKISEEARPYGFSVSHETISDTVDLIKVSGALDANTFDGLEEAINSLFAVERFRLIIDITEVNYIASAGIGVLIGATNEAEASGGK
ncbi:MAG: FHA domain-containing protein, partial [Planctomycetota bacterium]